MSTLQSLPERNLNKRQRSNDKSNDRVDIQQKQIEELSLMIEKLKAEKEEQSLMIVKLEAEKEEQTLMVAKLEAEKKEQSLMIVKQKENEPQYVLSDPKDSCGIVYIAFFRSVFKIGCSCKKRGTERIEELRDEIKNKYGKDEGNEVKEFRFFVNTRFRMRLEKFFLSDVSKNGFTIKYGKEYFNYKNSMEDDWKFLKEKLKELAKYVDSYTINFHYNCKSNEGYYDTSKMSKNECQINASKNDAFREKDDPEIQRMISEYSENNKQISHNTEKPVSNNREPEVEKSSNRRQTNDSIRFASSIPKSSKPAMSDIVYIPRTPKGIYHKNDKCSGMKEPKGISLSEAQKNNYRQCQKICCE